MYLMQIRYIDDYNTIFELTLGSLLMITLNELHHHEPQKENMQWIHNLANGSQCKQQLYSYLKKKQVSKQNNSINRTAYYSNITIFQPTIEVNRVLTKTRPISGISSGSVQMNGIKKGKLCLSASI